LLTNGDELNLNLPKFALPLYFFFLSGFLVLPPILLEENSQYFCILVAAFSPQNVTCLDAGLDGKI